MERTRVVSDDADRSGPFDIEREEAVLARVVDRSVPIQPQRASVSRPTEGRTSAAEVPVAERDVGGGREVDRAQVDEHVADGRLRDPVEDDQRWPSSPDTSVAGAAAGSGEPWEAGAVDGGAVVDGYPDGAAGPATSVAPPAVWPAARRRAPLPFAMVRRGYEPAEVEAYVAQQEDALAVAVERADTAERQLAEALAQLTAARARVAELEEQQKAEPPASIQALGDRVADILDSAWRAAEQLRAEAAGAAERAQAEADEVVRAAEIAARAQAAEIVAEAERHRRTVLEELAARRAEHDTEVARLTSERQAAVAELERLQAVLQRVLSPAAPSAGTSSAPASAGGGPGTGRPVERQPEPPVADEGHSGHRPGQDRA